MKKIQKVLLSRLPENFDLSKITTVAIPLAFGSPKNIDDGCHDRFDASIRNLSECFSKTLIIQTGGTAEEPLCTEMLEAVKSGKKYLWAQRFLAIRLGWGTRSEIANAFFIIDALSNQYLKNGIDTELPEFKVIIASNEAHLKRIKWYVNIYNFSGLRIEYREAQHEFGLRNTLREKLGTPLIKLKDFLFDRVYQCHLDWIIFYNKF